MGGDFGAIFRKTMGYSTGNFSKIGQFFKMAITRKIKVGISSNLLLDSCHELLSYDTTFQLGNFYISPLLFRHTIFSNKPTILAIFMLHERKKTETHSCMQWRI